jgi:uncharacterized protein (DUF58 family)
VNSVSRYLEPAVVEQLNQLSLSARSVVEGSTIGQHRSPVKGASVEFRQHRFYVPGDEPRRLDWRVLARTDRPYVKEYDEETNLRCLLLIDASGSMAYAGEYGSKFDYAARLLAAVAYLMLGQTESVGVGVASDALEHYLTPNAGPMQLSRVIDSLERTSPHGKSGLAAAMHDVAERMERRGLVIILSDFFAPPADLRKGLAHLRHERHEVIALQILDRHEQDFPFKTWCRFRGMEGEQSQIVEPALAARLYTENFNRHRQALAEACQTLRVEFQPMLTDRPMLDSLRNFLSRRNR